MEVFNMDDVRRIFDISGEELATTFDDFSSLRKESRKYLGYIYGASAILIVIYLVSGSYIPFDIGFVLFMGTAIVDKIRTSKLYERYAKQDALLMEKIMFKLKALGIYEEEGKIGYGYLVGDSIDPVPIYAGKEKLYIFKNFLSKTIIYKVHSSNLYFFSLYSGPAFKYTAIPISDLAFTECGFSHFEFLRQEAVKHGNLQIMEYFIYGVSILDFGRAKKKRPISINGGLSSMKKEEIYAASFEGKSVYLCRRQLDELGLKD
jgi:hypothetical protein